MAKKATKSAAKSSAKGKKPAIRNLGAKSAGSVKGGAITQIKQQ